MSEKLVASSVADALEAEYLAVANGQKKPGKLDLQTLVSAVQCIRELESASQPGGWQPIETAPKDGSMFLCWVSAIRHTYIDGEYGGEADVSEPDFCQWNNNSGDGYWDNMMGQIGDEYGVTHWMPLPSAPRAAPSAGNGDEKGGRG